MNLLETEIVKVEYHKNYNSYILSGEKDIIFNALHYSKENDFMVNNYGANPNLMLEKKVYVELNKKDEIISVATNNGETCVINLIVTNSEGAYKISSSKEYIEEHYSMSLSEYKKMLKYEIANNYSSKK